MKAIPCTLIVNTCNGYCLTPEHHNSVRAAVNAAKESPGFAYRIFDKEKNLVKKGFCN